MNWIKLSAWIALIGLILRILTTFLVDYLPYGLTSFIDNYGLIIFAIIALFVYGAFVLIARDHNLKFLIAASVIGFVTTFYNPIPGLAEVIFGIGVYPLKNNYGWKALTFSILLLLTGALFLGTIFAEALVLLAVLIAVFSDIFGVIVLFEASRNN